MRRGNVLVLTLIACAMLALVLVCGLEVATLRTAVKQDQITSLQLEQLHRTGIAAVLDSLNASGEAVSAGRVLLSDEPIRGQHRRVSVVAEEGRVLTLISIASLDDGSRRRHRVQLVALPLEARFAFKKDAQALYYDADRGVPSRWLGNHADEDLVVFCARRPGNRYTLGDGGGVTLEGSLVVAHLLENDFSVQLKSALTLAGNAVFAGDLHLLSGLSCQTAWIDGTLTISESVRLEADTVYLGEDVPRETLARIDATTIYMSHPPEVTEEDEALPEILPLPAEAQPTPERTCYLMFQQLNE